MSRWRTFGGAALVIGTAALGTGGAAEPNPQAQPVQQAAPSQQATSRPQVASPRARSVLDEVTPEQVLEWRKKFPFQSLAGRLSYEAARAPQSSPPLSAEAEQALRGPDWAQKNNRNESFRLLHEESAAEFASRAGFGISRMGVPLRSPSYFETPVARPIPFAKVPESAGRDPRVSLPTSHQAETAVGIARLMPSSVQMQSIHKSEALSFASPWQTGYVKSITQVAGFVPHALYGEVTTPVNLAHKAPLPNEPDAQKFWKLTRLELTSLLKHDTPRVYVSENLPRMEDLSSTKTRELSKFESESLAKLRAGEEVVVEATANRIEMFGALRAGKDCRQCHEVPFGTLLGAFSYDLRRDPPIKEVPAAGAVQ